MEVFIKEVSVGLGAVYHSFGQVWWGAKLEEGPTCIAAAFK